MFQRILRKPNQMKRKSCYMSSSMARAPRKSSSSWRSSISFLALRRRPWLKLRSFLGAMIYFTTLLISAQHLMESIPFVNQWCLNTNALWMGCHPIIFFISKEPQCIFSQTFWIRMSSCWRKLTKFQTNFLPSRTHFQNWEKKLQTLTTTSFGNSISLDS